MLRPANLDTCPSHAMVMRKATLYIRIEKGTLLGLMVVSEDLTLNGTNDQMLMQIRLDLSNRICPVMDFALSFTIRNMFMNHGRFCQTCLAFKRIQITNLET